ncbi:MAG: putative minor capsid protein [Eubacteriales bacterium]
MLKPIPARILKHSAILKKCTGTDAWEKPTYADYTLSRVCIQPSNKTVKSKDNTDITLSGLMFYDCRLSSPRNLDLKALKNQADAAGGDMLLVFGSETFTVETVETLYDDVGSYHHTEVGLT